MTIPEEPHTFNAQISAMDRDALKELSAAELLSMRGPIEDLQRRIHWALCHRILTLIDMQSVTLNGVQHNVQFSAVPNGYISRSYVSIALYCETSLPDEEKNAISEQVDIAELRKAALQELMETLRPKLEKIGICFMMIVIWSGLQ